jgi:hypothetical protein
MSRETQPRPDLGVRPSEVNGTGQAKPPLRTACSLFVKELIWRYAVRYQPTKRPICLYASRRSGSTLLMEIICANRGVMFSDQPFCLYTASSANLNLLPLFPYSQIAYPDAEEERILATYVEGLLSGRIKANVPWKFWHGASHFWNDRICLKITDAKTMIDWLDSHFDVHTVVLTRHPLAQAVSVSNVAWLSTGKGLLRNRGYVERWLNDNLEAYAWQVYREGTELERRVLDWALENLPMLSWLPEHSHWLYVSYEDLLVHTEAVVDCLADKLQLADRQRMLARVGQPSRSTRRESTAERKQLIRRGDREKLLNSWQSKVASQEARACFQLLERFGLDLYGPDSQMPEHRRIGRERFG